MKTAYTLLTVNSSSTVGIFETREDAQLFYKRFLLLQALVIIELMLPPEDLVDLGHEHLFTWNAEMDAAYEHLSNTPKPEMMN